MAWWLLGKESGTERQLRELQEQLLDDKKSDDFDDDECYDDDGNLIATRDNFGNLTPVTHPDGGENQTSPLQDDGTPFVQLRAEWDAERMGFKIDIDWNAPFLKHIVAMGVEGETDFEVAAYGATLMAHQIIETENDRRAVELATVKEVWDDQ